MNQDVPSTAGRRQFNDTAIKKLIAEGVSMDVAAAFVYHGIDKSGRYNSLRDHVCKMEYVRYLLPRTAADYKDPMRVGQMSPYVEELKTQRFFTEFAMSDVHSARFAGMFPEFNVIARGTTYNQHAFYANKRYAETELLVSLIYKHAAKYGHGLDPRSLVDVGGNETWHKKRDRGHVHCDNPILSSRDAARYTAREVFSGADPSTACRFRFSQCSHKADYGMAVHSTYDFSPKAIAWGMCKRKMSCFYFVVNVVPGLSYMNPGQYEFDGMIITLDKPPRGGAKVKYTFKHDASLEYTHSLSVHQSYLVSNVGFQIINPQGGVELFTYKVHSLRGNSLIGCIEKQQTLDFAPQPRLISGLSRKVYYITIKMLDVKNLEVDAEFFDRLVYQAAGARGAENYDIVSLYRYAKSLRQRVSINGIVLSSGYTMVPEQLVTACIASYALASAFRVESAEFFKKSSEQMIARRRQGLLRDTLRVVARALLVPFAALGELLDKATFYSKADKKLKELIAAGSSVSIMVDKPHAYTGAPFNPEVLKKPPEFNSQGLVKHVAGGNTSWVTPLQPGGWRGKLSPTFVSTSGVDRVYLSYGVPRMEPRELPSAAKLQLYDMSNIAVEQPMKSEEYRTALYAATLKKIAGVGAFDTIPLILPTGDRLYRKVAAARGSMVELPVDVGQSSLFGRDVVVNKASRMVTESDVYIVFRGVGDKAVSLHRPECYSRGTCVRFVLFYVDEVSRLVTQAKAGKPVGVTSVDVADAIKDLASGASGSLTVEMFVAASELDSSRPGEDWEAISPVQNLKVPYSVHKGDGSYVERNAQRGLYYMTGGVGDGPATPAPSVDSALQSSVRTLYTVPEGDEESGRAFKTESDEAVDAVRATEGLFDDGDERVARDAMVESAQDTDDEAGVRDRPPEGGAVLDLASDAGDGEGTVSSTDVVWGRSAMLEQLSLCEASRDVALASSAEIIDLAVGVARGQAPVSTWGVAMEGKQGSPLPVRVTGGEFFDALTGQLLPHMAVSDGLEVYDRLCNPPSDGLYVTSDVMAIYTGGAIRDAIASVVNDTYRCDVVNMDGVAGCGKTYTIAERFTAGDVVLSETRSALKELRERIHKLNKNFDDCGWTLDGFLCRVPRTYCNTLWIDESLRLHGAKIFSVVKMLKPNCVYCFGDSKQIPILPFVPGFDFMYSEFPFTSVTVKRDTWRSPADVCFITSHPLYYGFHVQTHSRVERSVEGPDMFLPQMFHAKPDGVVVLTYTQVAKEDLLKSGVKNVMTIGESQGSTLDDVWLFRDSMLAKPLYFDLGQTLVALTRHRRTFRYVTVAINDTSAVALAIRYLRGKVTSLLLASHMLGPGGTRVAGRAAGSGSDSEDVVDVSAAVPVVTDDGGAWADDEVSDFYY